MKKSKKLFFGILLFQTLMAGNGFAKGKTYKFDFGEGIPTKGYTKVTVDDTYSDEKGYGFDFILTDLKSVERGGSDVAKDFITSVGGKPFYFSVKVPEGNYRVKITIGDKQGTSYTSVRAESRRLMALGVKTEPGRIVTKQFNLNIRRPKADDGTAIRLKPREYAKPDWDDRLTIEFTDLNPAICAVEIEKIDAVTVFVCGDSTVVDQDNEPWCSWGQILPLFFDTHVSIANYAESGEDARSFTGERRWHKLMDKLKKGDYALIQFGHNDGKYRDPYGIYKEAYRTFIREARGKGAIPVIVTPMNRRTFNNGLMTTVFAPYVEALQQLSQEEKVTLIDLNAMSITLFNAMGEEASKKAFVHYDAGAFYGEPKRLADNTHFNAYGAFELAKCMIEGIKASNLPLKKYVAKDFTPFDPAKPDDPASIKIPVSQYIETHAEGANPNFQGIYAPHLPEWVKTVGAQARPAGRNRVPVVAPGDGATLVTAQIQSAIDECAAKGGGRVEFAPGVYITGAVYLKNNVELNIGKDVTLKAVNDVDAFPEISTRIAGVEMVWPSAIINVIDMENVAVTGEGAIDGDGRYLWMKYGEMARDYNRRGLRWIVDYDCKRVRSLLVQNSKNVTVSGLTFLRAGFWTIQVLYSSYCTMSNITIRNNMGGHGPSTDGVDIDSSHHILVEGCDIDCNDDNICLKAGRDWDGLRVNRPTEYVFIHKCIARKGAGLMTCGSETSGSIRHIYCYDSQSLGTGTALRIKSAMNRGGTVENIYMDKVTTDSTRYVITLEMNWNPSYSYSTLPPEYEGKDIPAHWKAMLEKVSPEQGLPHFRNIYISNLKAQHAGTFISCVGADNSIINHVELKNLDIHAGKAGVIRNTENVVIDNVNLRTDDGSQLNVDN
jgi:polygalacturonase/lysophospholipase L1-like esterase